MAGICASTWVAFTVMYANYFAGEDAARAMGSISVMIVSGQMLGMLMSGTVTDMWGDAAPFITGAVIAGVGLVLGLLLKERRNSRMSGVGITLAMARSTCRRLLLQVSLLSILAHRVLFITMFGFTPLKAETLGITGYGLTLIVFAFMLPHALASMFTAKWFAPHFGNWVTIRMGFVLSTICTVSIAYTDSFAMLALTQAINGFAQGLHLPLLLGLAIRDVQPSGRATAMGLYQAVYSIGMFTGPFLAGWLNDSWGMKAFWSATCLALPQRCLVCGGI